MTTLDNIDDLLRIVREDEAVRAALRREVLTEDLLSLPTQFAAMLEEVKSLRQGTNFLLEEFKVMRRDTNFLLEEFRSLRQDTNFLLEEVKSLRQDTNSLLETQTSMLEEQRRMSGDIHALHGMYRRQHDDLARFRGNYAFDAARRNRWDIAQLFASLRGMRRIQSRTLTEDELGDLLEEGYDAVDALNLPNRYWETFLVPDMIASVTQVRPSGPPFYIAVEASYTGNVEDLLRATEHARILRSATGLDAYAVVASVRMAPSMEGRVYDDVEQFVSADDENAALWYRLAEEHMEPLDPE